MSFCDKDQRLRCQVKVMCAILVLFVQDTSNMFNVLMNDRLPRFYWIPKHRYYIITTSTSREPGTGTQAQEE